jgi:hypothetical protein
MSQRLLAPPEDLLAYRNVTNHALVPGNNKLGWKFRLPQWDALNASQMDVIDPPLLRHDNDKNVTYGSFCSQLLHSLTGASRAWASYEFFYSDIDRPWYNQNDLLNKAAKLGIDADARLTYPEWRAIRRRVQKKPRLFSKRFIADQTEELWKHRNSVRLLQQKPLAITPPFDIPRRISIGSTVTAFSRRYKIIQRGVVLSYDSLNAAYVVLFDRKEFGCEFCPDTEVARHGGAEILIHGGQKTRIVGLVQSGSSTSATSGNLQIWLNAVDVALVCDNLITFNCFCVQRCCHLTTLFVPTSFQMLLDSRQLYHQRRANIHPRTPRK